MVQLWPGDIFNCFVFFMVKKHTAFNWKYAILGYLFPPGSAEARVRCGGKIKYILIAYFLGNIYAKNCRNRTVCVKIIASCKGWMFFLRHSVYIICLFTSYASHLSFFLHFFLTYLLPYLSFPLRILPLCFQAGRHKRWPNLGFFGCFSLFCLIVFLFLMHD